MTPTERVPVSSPRAALDRPSLALASSGAIAPAGAGARTRTRGGGLGWSWWAVVLGTSLLLRGTVALLLLGGMPMVSDAHDYVELALRLVSGDVHGAFYWPPGESVVLAAAFAVFGQSVLVARCVTIVLATMLVPLTALVARELAGDRVARSAGWVAAAYPPAVLLSGQAYAQHLAAVCLVALAYFGLRALRERRLSFYALAGVALGVGCLTRPSMASVLPVLAVATALRAKAAWRDRPAIVSLAMGAAATACVCAALVVPVVLHNARDGGGWTLSTNNERNLFLGNNPYTPDYKTSHLGQRALDEIAPDARAYLEAIYATPDARSAMKRAAVEYMLGHPVRTAWRTLNRSTSFWGFDYIASREIQKWLDWGSRGVLPFLVLEAGGYLLVAALALIAIVAFAGPARSRRPEGAAGDDASAANGSDAAPAYDAGWRTWLVALALAYEVPYAIAFSGGAYHFPAVPLLIPFAAIVLASPRASWRRFRRSAPAWVALGVFALIQAQYAYYAWTMSS